MSGLYLNTYRKIEMELKSYTYPDPINSCLTILQQKTGLTREKLIICNIHLLSDLFI